jgi:hypothetical protein
MRQRPWNQGESSQIKVNQGKSFFAKVRADEDGMQEPGIRHHDVENSNKI